MTEDAEVVADAFLQSYAAVYGTVAPRHRCDQRGRCVYDERCPLFLHCDVSDYEE